MEPEEEVYKYFLKINQDGLRPGGLTGWTVEQLESSESTLIVNKNIINIKQDTKIAILPQRQHFWLFILNTPV